MGRRPSSAAPTATRSSNAIGDALAAAGLPGLPRTAWLAIDLDRIAANLEAIRAAVPPGVRVEPVVKADAYGHGSVPVTWALARAGADGVSVATWDEAMELRAAGLALPILLLYPLPPPLAPEAARMGVTLTVGEEPLLGRTLEAWTASRGRARGTRLRVQLELETGLGRGGIAAERAPEAVARIRATPDVELMGVWSHLGSPDDPRRTAGQSRRFEAALAVLAADLAADHAAGPGLPRHLVASAGFLTQAAPVYEAVRPGLSVYGVLPDGLRFAGAGGGLAKELRPALSLRARPVRVANLPAGTAISYGSTFVTDRPSRIATIPLGYADGYQRARSGRATALVRGREVSVVGSIAMDALMVDVTDLPGPPVDVDDEFVLLGEQGAMTLSAESLALACTTISWEVLAGMARRLPRVYYAAASPAGLRTLTEDTGPWHRSSA